MTPLNPRYLLDRDVILVTVQYRLGPLGSLNLGDDSAAGNQALWDQKLGKGNKINLKNDIKLNIA